jgi:hypothetical protein
MHSEEACQTLKTLEQLIAVATWIGGRDPQQRAALIALRRRRSALRKLLRVRQSLAIQPVVPLAAWREPSNARAASRRSDRPGARARSAAL